MNAILAAQQAAGGPTAAPANANAGVLNSPSAPAQRWRMPSVEVLREGASQVLPLEKTQLAQTKTKPPSLVSLSGESALTQGIQAGVRDATWSAATHINSGACRRPRTPPKILPACSTAEPPNRVNTACDPRRLFCQGNMRSSCGQFQRLRNFPARMSRGDKVSG